VRTAGLKREVSKRRESEGGGQTGRKLDFERAASKSLRGPKVGQPKVAKKIDPLNIPQNTA
jgi:hypothetical protein